ncbi:hypothetical protein MVEN_01671400 [Mycena venus]|uniref:Methyltransferase domain-containing protein n=1 Tax=Mycena venus TaxID=2733690 RepID=A0A8H6XRD7_9AGAR|nr:hypothetical protein MVEN_01671400 [Mycena venus]
MPRLTLWPLPVVCIFLAALYFLAQQHDAFLDPLTLRLQSWTDSEVVPDWAPVPISGSRLNLTLAGNELRYQEAYIVSVSGIPSPVIRLGSLNWHHFIGTMGDGGKWVCGLERATHRSNCVVYSMGVERQSSFEQEILHQSEQCQVYGEPRPPYILPLYTNQKLILRAAGFDFSVSEWGPELRADTAVNSRAHFYPWKIGGADNHDANPKEYSLQGIMKEFGHDFIDIWKIDIEGSEFSALTAVIESFKGQPLPFGQMQIEIHIGYAQDTHTVGAIDKWWTMLEDAGLRPFWTELNLLDVNSLRRGPPVAEWSFINIRGKHALLDDSLPDYP